MMLSAYHPCLTSQYTLTLPALPSLKDFISMVQIGRESLGWGMLLYLELVLLTHSCTMGSSVLANWTSTFVV